MKKEKIEAHTDTHGNDMNNRVPSIIDLLDSHDKSVEEEAIKEKLTVATARFVEVDALHSIMAKGEAVSVFDVIYQISIDINTLGTIMKTVIEDRNKTTNNNFGVL